MSHIIEVKSISKKYKITHQHEDHTSRSLLGDIARAIKNPLGRTSKRDKEEFWALKDVSFKVEQGDVIGIIGRNGSGKSTLLKVLSRITEPTGGEAILRGRVASLLEVGTGFHPELTGRENIYFNGSILGMTKKEIDSKFNEIVAFAETEKFLDTPVKFYSSGMYVRLAFAVAAHLDPDILIVDEVLAVGDAQFQKKCLGKMSDVAKQGRTVLFVSHNMLTVEQLCNKLVYMQEGKVVREGSDVKDIIKEYLFGTTQEKTTEWKGKAEAGEYMTVKRFALTDKSGKTIVGPIDNTEEAYIQIEGQIHEVHRSLSFGYSVFSEDGSQLYWSFQTDTKEADWPELKKGSFAVRSKLPNRFFDEGVYRFELAASLFSLGWFYEPGTSSIALYISMINKPTGSPYWVSKRPTLLAPLLPWETANKQKG